MDRWLNKIILGDCLDVMREMPDKCVDLVLTDPPYGIGEAAGKNKSRGLLAPPTDFEYAHWDDKKIPHYYLDEVKRVSKNQIIFGGNYYCGYLGDSSCFIVWDKEINGDFADCELAWTSFPTAVRKFKYRWNGMLQENMREKEKRIHPTQKPVALFEWILNHYSKESDIILDPFSGSGTVAAACINLKRQYIGIEIDPGYVYASQKRIEDATRQQRLFV
jgi:site-specific DNA-methyltransferase (adenine-specific)